MRIGEMVHAKINCSDVCREDSPHSVTTSNVVGLVRNWRQINLSVSAALTTERARKMITHSCHTVGNKSTCRLLPSVECKSSTHSFASIFDISA